MTTTRTIRGLIKRFEPHLPKPNPSAFSTSFSNYISKHNLVKAPLLGKKPSTISVPARFNDAGCLGSVPGSLFSHLMHRDCFGVGCIAREETLPEWKDRLLIVRAVESRMGARMGDVKGDIIRIDAKTKKEKVVKKSVMVSELVALGGKWTMVEGTTFPINETDSKKATNKASTRSIKKCTKDTTIT